MEPINFLEKIWFMLFIIQVVCMFIHFPVFKLTKMKKNYNLNIDYEKWWPFWSINVSICIIYSASILLYALWS